MTVEITYDQQLIEEIAVRFDLREPNKNALEALVREIVAAGGVFAELVADLATGVGKTYLMSSLIEYLAMQGVRHVLVVTPGSTIQTKTLNNFDAASAKYVAGADVEPFIVTPENFRAATVGAVLRDPRRLKVFVFNVQQLIRPTDKVSRKVRSEDENLGDALYAHLQNADDLFVIADEHHVYREKAKAFSAAIRDLQPVALVGLTATPDKDDYAKVVFQYTLGEAIADGHVKTPVIVYRKDGTKDERTQLKDACQLLRHKDASYANYSQTQAGEKSTVRPCLFVVCQTIEHATEVGQILAEPGFIGNGSQVLEITSQSSDEALEALASVEDPGSPIRAIVSVNMLREGWDVKNIAVIVALRKLASQTLTEQILGRGLRLPFGQLTRAADVDQVDLVAHDSYKQLLAQKDVLRQRIQLPNTAVEVDPQGFATTAEVDPTQPLNPADPKEQQVVEEWSPLTGGGGSFPRAPGQTALFDGLEDADTEKATDEGAASLLFRETDDRVAAPQPTPMGRVKDAPQIVFPRRESRLSYSTFNLSDIPDGDAEAEGATFIKEVPTFIFREALTAKRTGGQVKITAVPLDHAEAQQTVAGLDVVRTELVNAIMLQPEVTREKTSKGAATRLVKAFLKGAGVKEGDAAEWGEKRRQQAVEGMRRLIRSAITGRKKEKSYEIVPVTLPLEPVNVEPDARDAYNDQFAKHVQFTGWAKNIMPMATFDAGTTEFALAHLLDRDPNIQWWLRVYVGGQAFIPTTERNYFPDFITLHTDGTQWLIEGKSDKNAKDADVLRKREAAEKWARHVRDTGDHGTWRYMFATETDIKQAAGSWQALMVTTQPE